VATGDWTQRARLSQFRQARAFLKEIHIPVVSVAGNHDVPLYNLWIRFVSPFHRYQKYIARHTQDHFRDGHVSVAGICSVDILTPVAGRAHSRELKRAREFFELPSKVRILALHHPLPLVELSSVPADIILSGHAHTSKIEWLENPSGPKVLHISSGTSSSSRLREEVNSFHLLEIVGRNVSVQTFALSDQGFEAEASSIKNFKLPELP